MARGPRASAASALFQILVRKLPSLLKLLRRFSKPGLAEGCHYSIDFRFHSSSEALISRPLWSPPCGNCCRGLGLAVASLAVSWAVQILFPLFVRETAAESVLLGGKEAGQFDLRPLAKQKYAHVKPALSLISCWGSTRANFVRTSYTKKTCDTSTAWAKTLKAKSKSS